MMSKENYQLCLSGYGYLVDVRQDMKRMVACIKVLPSMNNANQAQSDEILLDCDVDNLALLTQLEPMRQARRAKRAVMLRFSCAYGGFGYHYSASMQDDPDHMLMFKAKLVSVGEWYCDGQRVDHVACSNTASSKTAA